MVFVVYKTRTKFDKNEIIIYDNYAEIILYNIKNIEKARTIIDIEDISKAENYKWNYSNGYVRNVKNQLFLHNLILNHIPDKNFIADHINRNRLDNRKINLRIVDYQENGINKGKQSNNTTGFVGIHFDKSRNKFSPYIKINGKKIFLGRFDQIEDAIIARKNAEIKYFGYEVNREYDINTIYKRNE